MRKIILVDKISMLSYYKDSFFDEYDLINIWGGDLEDNINRFANILNSLEDYQLYVSVDPSWSGEMLWQYFSSLAKARASLKNDIKYYRVLINSFQLDDLKMSFSKKELNKAINLGDAKKEGFVFYDGVGVECKLSRV